MSVCVFVCFGLYVSVWVCFAQDTGPCKKDSVIAVTHSVLYRYVALSYLFFDHSRCASINLIWAPHTLSVTSRGRPANNAPY